MTYKITLILAALLFILLAEPGPKLPALFLGAIAVSLLLLLTPSDKISKKP